jgi:AbrB family looped-hinge helix DNA binding protein
MVSKTFHPVKGVVIIGVAGGSKGGSARVTIPQEIMEHLGLKPGDALESSVDENGRIIFEVKK